VGSKINFRVFEDKLISIITRRTETIVWKRMQDSESGERQTLDSEKTLSNSEELLLNEFDEVEIKKKSGRHRKLLKNILRW